MTGLRFGHGEFNWRDDEGEPVHDEAESNANHPFRARCFSTNVEYHEDPTGKIASLKS
jgi:hypothetical protein